MRWHQMEMENYMQVLMADGNVLLEVLLILHMELTTMCGLRLISQMDMRSQDVS